LRRRLLAPVEAVDAPAAPRASGYLVERLEIDSRQRRGGFPHEHARSIGRATAPTACIRVVAFVVLSSSELDQLGVPTLEPGLKLLLRAASRTDGPEDLADELVSVHLGRKPRGAVGEFCERRARRLEVPHAQQPRAIDAYTRSRDLSVPMICSEGQLAQLRGAAASRGERWASSVERKPMLRARPWPAHDGRAADIARSKVADLTRDSE
jgi:hypothetical protein